MNQVSGQFAQYNDLSEPDSLSFLTLTTKLQSHWVFGVGFPDSGFQANPEKEILIFD